MRRSALVLTFTTISALLVPAAAAAAPGPGPGDYRPVRGPSAPEEHRYLQKGVPGIGIPRHAYADAAAAALQLPATGQ